jgi:hypothetical protein
MDGGVGGKSQTKLKEPKKNGEILLRNKLASDWQKYEILNVLVCRDMHCVQLW